MPSDTFEVVGISYALYPHTEGDNPRMTLAAQEKFRKDTRAAVEAAATDKKTDRFMIKHILSGLGDDVRKRFIQYESGRSDRTG